MKEDFSKRLKELRIENGISQQAIADKLNIARISYLHWEQGKTEPSINNICLLCKIFNVSADYLFGLENDDGSRSEASYEFEYDHKNTHLIHKEKK